MAKFPFDDGNEDINDYDASGLPEEDNADELDRLINEFDSADAPTYRAGQHSDAGRADKARAERPTAAKKAAQSGDGEKTEKKSEKKSKKKKKKKARKPLSPKAKRVLTVVISIILVFALTATDVCGYVLINMIKTVNGDIQVDLNEYKANQNQTTIIYAMENDKPTEIARLHGEENRIWVSIDKIPENLQNAYIALEDKRFKTHSGVDWFRTASVVLVHHFSQGGSTITQQLIKNLTGENGRTFIRKFREIQYALNLEKHFSKETILEAYLNTLYLDAGCYGVETASEYYFGKSVSELNLAECASIAAITQEPRTYNPILHPEKNKERQKVCLDNMLLQGMITQKEHDDALDYELILTNSEKYTPKKEDNEDGETLASSILGAEPEIQSYYVDYVIDSVIDDLMTAYNYSKTQAWRKVYYGGLKIYSAVDMNVQKTMEDIYYNRSGFPQATNSYGELIQSCMTVMDYEGRVVGIVGQAGEKESNRCLNIATDTPRQPGSSIKPLSVYSLAVDTDDYSWSYPMVQNYGIMVGGERWPVNYGGDPGSPSSYKNIQQALAPSDNTIPAQIVYHFTPQKCYEWLTEKFHITTGTDADKDYSAMAVGGMSYGLTSLEMTAAYAVFGNGGKYYKPYCYYRVTNSTGSQILLSHNDEGEQVISSSSAYVMNKLLQTVVTSSNGTARYYPVSGYTTFAKTGTTTDNKDYWFVGGTPYYVSAIWFGYSQHPEDMTGKVSGKPAGNVFQRVMNAIHSGLDEKQFDKPDDVVQKTYCRSTGLIAGSNCGSTGTGWYKTSNIPATCSGNHSNPSADTTAATTQAGQQQATTTPATPTTQPTTPVNPTPTPDPEPAPTPDPEPEVNPD